MTDEHHLIKKMFLHFTKPLVGSHVTLYVDSLGVQTQMILVNKLLIISYNYITYETGTQHPQIHNARPFRLFVILVNHAISGHALCNTKFRKFDDANQTHKSINFLKNYLTYCILFLPIIVAWFCNAGS